MICLGIDVATDESVVVEFAQTILSVRRGEPGGDTWLAPGFVDLQVNGFAGVDFNDPNTPIDEIGRALNALFSTECRPLPPSDRDHRAGRRNHSDRRNLRRAQIELPKWRSWDCMWKARTSARKTDRAALIPHAGYGLRIWTNLPNGRRRQTAIYGWSLYLRIGPKRPATVRHS